MSIILIPTDAQSSKTDSGLDVLRRIFSCDSSREAALAALPARYTADSAINYNVTYACDPPIATTYPTMFLMDIQVRETGIKLCEVDMTFNGSQTGDLPAPKHDLNQVAVSAQAQTPAGPLSMTVLTPESNLTWFSTEAGIPGLVTAPAPSTGFYTISGILTFTNGLAGVSGVGTSFLSQIGANDVILVIATYPVGSALYPSGSNVPYIVTVHSVDSNTHLTLSDNWIGPNVTNVKTGSLAPYASGIFGISGAAFNNIQVISIRFPSVGFGGLLTGVQVGQWGPLLVRAYFVSVPVTSIQATEIVPGQFWKNVQKSTIQLFPAFAS
jgi:hypothetical protein